jgi:hypothetical protein
VIWSKGATKSHESHMMSLDPTLKSVLQLYYQHDKKSLGLSKFGYQGHVRESGFGTCLAFLLHYLSHPGRDNSHLEKKKKVHDKLRRPEWK